MEGKKGVRSEEREVGSWKREKNVDSLGVIQMTGRNVKAMIFLFLACCVCWLVLDIWRGGRGRWMEVRRRKLCARLD